MKLGQFEYRGNGKILEQNIEYTLFDVGSEVEAYPENESDPIVMNKGAFATMRRGNLEQVDGDTPMA